MSVASRSCCSAGMRCSPANCFRLLTPEQMKGLFRDRHAWTTPGSRILVTHETKQPDVVAPSIEVRKVSVDRSDVSHERLQEEGCVKYTVPLCQDTAGELGVSVLLSNRPYPPTQDPCNFAEIGWSDLAYRLRRHATQF